MFSQRPTLELTFTAENNGVYVQLDSIKVMNRTQGGDTVLYWPDTVLSIYYVGIPEISKGENSFQVFQNYPNPVTDQTTVSLYVPEKDKVSIIVTDILGRMIVKSERVLDKGKHSFRFTPGNSSLYFFIACWQGQSSSIKILQTGFNSGGKSSLEYLWSEDSSPQVKAMQAIQSFSFTPGDELLFIGYANGLESGMLDSPEESTTYTFQFATNIPCPGTPTVEYEGQVYNTIQVFSQCWLKENLNVGTMIPGSPNQSNNGTIEKYCYNNAPDSCTKYGGLYQWDEMMQYTTQQGARGICPPGWHVPTDEEWKVLEGAVDSQYGIGNILWDSWGYRGYDAGTNLKTTSGWYANFNGADLFGFSGLPGGYRYYGVGFFDYVGIYGGWWTSTEGSGNGVWGRDLSYDFPEVGRSDYYGWHKTFGFSVRCLRDF
ncbi:MAG: T9SS type A sorting domain-containing protein [Bacteroidales bacterium]|nr:T9SS type A sorting domain-containing protein [Bacteroidales bacterium]